MSDSEGKTLTRNQDRALSALMSLPTLALVAAQVGVTERTLHRWINDDSAFKAEYLKLRREIVGNSVLQLQKASNNAVNCLISTMNDLDNPASARVSAAVKILELSLKAIETDDLESRITVLEQRWESRNGHH
jgi:type II secretory pathway component GspD/PulD (secretin)